MHTIAMREDGQRMHKFELITMGRTILDAYANQVGCGLEEASSFSKYVGGCPANIAIGTARLGVRIAHITRVGDDHHGRFIRAQLAREGVDVSHVHTDPARLTGVAFLGIRDRDTFPLLHYRENCADMAIAPADYDKDFIGSAKAFLVSGSHVTTPAAAENLLHAVRLAKSAGTKVIFDIDYRPVFWSLVAKDLGESRYVGSETATRATQQVIPHADLIVATEEEIRIAGGSGDVLESLSLIRKLSSAPIVMKRGPEGCVVFDGPIPRHLDDGIVGLGFPVEVFNVVGAGDGFLSGFLSGWLRDMNWIDCCRRGNACGALVVSRHGCSPASPTAAELDWYLANAARESRLYDNRMLEQVHRATTRRARPQPALLIDCSSASNAFPPQSARGMPELAEILSEVVLEHKKRDRSVGIILDGTGCEDALFKIGSASDWVLRSIDDPTSGALRFVGDKTAAVILRSWPQSQIVKCSVSAAASGSTELRNERLRELQLAVEMWGHDLALAPADGVSASAFEDLALELKGAGVEPDWWLMPSGIAPAEAAHIARAIATLNLWCNGLIAPVSSLSDAGIATSGLSQVVRWNIPHATLNAWATGKMNSSTLQAELRRLLDQTLGLLPVGGPA